MPQDQSRSQPRITKRVEAYPLDPSLIRVTHLDEEGAVLQIAYRATPPLGLLGVRPTARPWVLWITLALLLGVWVGRLSAG